MYPIPEGVASIRRTRRMLDRLHAWFPEAPRPSLNPGCPFELAEGRDSPERIAVRHNYWIELQREGVEGVMSALRRTI